ncbi:hypothetical protein CDCA_CDCA15G4064 [Cyanidium caldarium]|uniref:Guanine nucleotide-binding protein subunit beta-like protein n=1 Tax=Cyanidium caldarium TaxID=2771 RepID=A0AAV9J149_CYACA|nr:hypothetical protein CDCA_CDCA15G4064 [Cyanidium caldarium]
MPSKRETADSASARGETEQLAQALERDAPLRETVVTRHANWVQTLAFSPTGRSLLTGSNDGSVRVSEPESGVTKLEIRGDVGGQVYATAVTPAADAVAIASGDGKIYVYDTDTVTEANGQMRLSARLRRVLNSHGGNAVLSLAIGRDAKTLYSGSVGRDILIHDMVSGKELGRLVGHEGYVYTLAVSPDGALLASGSGDETVRVWNLADGTCLHALTEHIGWVWGVDFHPRDGTLASGSNDRTVCIWNAKTGEMLHKVEVHEHVYSLQFAPTTGRFLLCGTSGKRPIRVYDTEKGYAEHVRASTQQAGRVFAVAFAKAETAFAAGSEDGTVVLYTPAGRGEAAAAAAAMPATGVATAPTTEAGTEAAAAKETKHRGGGFCGGLCACFGSSSNT